MTTHDPARLRHLLDHPLIGERYFVPRAAVMDDATIVTSGPHRLGCYLEQPQTGDDALTIVHWHGNGEIVPDYRPDIANLFLSLGVNLMLAEYRGYGASSSDPALVGMFDDIAPIMAATGAPPERVIVFGRSIGSIYAIECARQFPTIAGLVLESGIADPLERVLLRVEPAELDCTHDEIEAAAAMFVDHRAKLAAYRGPLLVMHAVHDMLIDISHARRNHEWAGSAQKQLKEFTVGGHNDIQARNLDSYFATLDWFIQ
ncbi:MAG: alpha/beta hydrolase, partial [Planctomycetota bacterium]